MFAKVALEQMSPEEGARTAEREIKRIFELNASPTLEHLELLFYETLYPRWLLDTRLVGLLVVAITLLLAVPAGYSLARLTGRAGERLGITIFLTSTTTSSTGSARASR